MKQDEIQIWMLTAFIIVLAVSLYKIYIIFNKPPSGVSTEMEHEELRDMIISFIQKSDISDPSNKTLFEALVKEEGFEGERYKNFNQNRFNQLVQGLFYTYKVDTLSELIESIHVNIADNV